MILEELDCLRGCFTGAVVDFRATCTASDNRMCHVVHKLSAWNELLFAARFELRELPGTFGMLSLQNVYEPSGGNAPASGDEQFLRGCLVISWLLARHRCVISFQAPATLLENKGATVALCDALRKNSWLRNLKLEWPDSATGEVCATVEGLTSLEELECSLSTCFPGALAEALGKLVRSSPSLVVLRLSCLSILENRIKSILETIATSHTLKEFILDGVLVRRRYHPDPPKYQMIGAALTTLEMPVGNKCVQKFLLEDIAENRTIRKLTLTMFIPNEESIKLVEKIFRDNNVLLNFSLISPSAYLAREYQAVYDRWIDALRENRTLEELTLPFLIWSLQSWSTFFQMLSAKISLKKLHIQRSLAIADNLPSLCEALVASGAEEKVSLGSYDVVRSTDLIKCKSFKQIFLYWQECELVRISVLSQLPQCSHLTQVGIGLSGRDLALYSAMAEYLRVTSQLEVLCLNVLCTNKADEPSTRWTVMFEPLSQNAGIRKLVVYLDSPNKEDYEELADAVTRSRSIRRFEFKDQSHANIGIFSRRLSRSIVDNYTLLRVGFRTQVDADSMECWFAVSETTRRNFSVLARATRFVKAGEFDRHVAAALERLYQYPALMKELAKLTKIDKAEIVASVRDRVHSIRSIHEFMRITGVVRERVACHPRGDSRMQLDELNEDCWGHVRRYLTVDDVKDNATAVQKT